MMRKKDFEDIGGFNPKLVAAEDVDLLSRLARKGKVALDPDLPELHNNLASVEWGLGDQAAAEQQFREALRIEPGVAARSRCSAARRIVVL